MIHTLHSDLLGIYKATQKDRLAEGHEERSKAIWKLVRDKVQRDCLWNIYGEPEKIDEPESKKAMVDSDAGGGSGTTQEEVEEEEEEQEEEELECK